MAVLKQCNLCFKICKEGEKEFEKYSYAYLYLPIDKKSLTLQEKYDKEEKTAEMIDEIWAGFKPRLDEEINQLTHQQIYVDLCEKCTNTLMDLFYGHKIAVWAESFLRQDKQIVTKKKLMKKMRAQK